MAKGSKSETEADPQRNTPDEMSEIRQRALTRWDNEGGAVASMAGMSRY